MVAEPITPILRDRVRQLCRQGWEAEWISYDLGLPVRSVLTILHDAGLVPPRRPHSPIVNYVPPAATGEGLTPLQRRERRLSRWNAFRVEFEYELTADRAEKVVATPLAVLEAHFGIGHAEACLMAVLARRFLANLERACPCATP